MLVDDDADIRRTVKAVLQKNGYHVIAAVNGEDCLKKLDSCVKKPDLVLMDIMMPGMPAKDVVRKIKGVKIAYLSVVMVSEAEKKELMEKSSVSSME